MQVLKFGGSSVANATNINKVVTIVEEAVKKDHTIVVVSALGGLTANQASRPGSTALPCMRLRTSGDGGFGISRARPRWSRMWKLSSPRAGTAG